MRAPARSWLYVPGHKERLISKALDSGADAVIIDLEDAVPAEAKDQARDNAAMIAADRGDTVDGPQIWVRINQAGSPWHDHDVAALAGSGIDGLRVPKVESVESVCAIAEASRLPLLLIIESARGLLDAPALARAHPSVVGISLGEADLSADLRVGPNGLDWARGWLVTAARAAGLPSPAQSVWTHVRDLDGLRASSIRSREYGFHGRTVIHPTQIPIVNDVFTPSDAEITAAQAVVDAAQEAADNGSAALLDSDGCFIDPAVVEQARVVLSLAQRDGIAS
ncbi:MAG: CoA ester lyase [Rhodococcus sp. (in: high G+C Gram-positive bacteria)]|uniref:HpcH/HpaI aldolase/citrate lyase family protein n=1 Tax=Rhodococcus sp. TaxID=1831 RepID=UPI003BB0402E